MTNYPRDEFDRVPEFNTRVGSHHAHGWAQSAAAKSAGGSLRWVIIAAVSVLIIGAISFFVFNQQPASPTATEPTATTTASEETSSSPTPSETEEPSPSFSIDDSEVLYGQRVGIYNASGVRGSAGTAQEQLLEEGFTNLRTGDWSRLETESAVYYASNAYEMTAQKTAAALGIEAVLQTSNIPDRISIVIGSDVTEEQ
ncbi:LytR C-terminal domain-containing protein [Glutamicibacter endophyticus]|uniref:LytR C-terminal domain-containing protein n=1 Tax=Glutamicibacter endophyticus TaxID=1522174 RepID=UPI003AF0E5D9